MVDNAATNNSSSATLDAEYRKEPEEGGGAAQSKESGDQGGEEVASEESRFCIGLDIGQIEPSNPPCSSPVSKGCLSTHQPTGTRPHSSMSARVSTSCAGSSSTDGCESLPEALRHGNASLRVLKRVEKGKKRIKEDRVKLSSRVDEQDCLLRLPGASPKTRVPAHLMAMDFASASQMPPRSPMISWVLRWE